MPLTSELYDGVALASAARTVQTDSDPFENPGARGILILIDVTVASGTGGLSPQLAVVSPVDGSLSLLGANPTPITTTGKKGYVYYPAASMGTGNLIVQNHVVALPQAFAIRVSVGDASSYTYSVSYALLF